MTDLTAQETVVLAAISDQPRYGYELVQRIAELTDDRVSIRPGNLYRVLHKLVTHKLVTEAKGAGTGQDPRRRYFQATALGRRTAANELAMYATVLKRAPALKELISNA